MNGGFLDQSRPCDDLLVTPADVVPRWRRFAEVCLDQCYPPTQKREDMMGEKRLKVKIGWSWIRMYWITEMWTCDLVFDAWNEVSAVLDYQDSKEGGRADFDLSPLWYMPISCVSVYIYIYMHIVGIYMYMRYTTEMKLATFILFIHLCYLKTGVFWIFFRVCISGEEEGEAWYLRKQKQNDNARYKNGDMAMLVSDDFWRILWCGSTWIYLHFVFFWCEWSVRLVTGMIGGTWLP